MTTDFQSMHKRNSNILYLYDIVDFPVWQLALNQPRAEVPQVSCGSVHLDPMFGEKEIMVGLVVIV